VVAVTDLLILLAMAFAGGAVAAAVGALPAFSLTGVVIVGGEALDLVGAGPIDSVGALGTLGITGGAGLGAGLGPHVAFGGGAAAAAYAARKGKLDTGFGYHEAKNVLHPLGVDARVLLVGGAFGALGYLAYRLSLVLGLPFDPVAFSIVLTAFLHRIAFGYPLVGAVGGGLLDMTPFERGERRKPVAGDRPGEGTDEAGNGTDGAATEAPTDGGPAAAEAGVGAGVGGAGLGPVAGGDRRFAVEPWLPGRYHWSTVTATGAVVGVLSACLTYLTGSVVIGFALAVAVLPVIVLRTERVPVAHHMALPAGLLIVALTPGVSGPGVTPARIQALVPLWIVVVAGASAGVVGALLGELCQRVFYAHADTHLDPPAASILLTSLLVAVLDVAGLFQQTFVPTLGL
jgi:hypothetical protein